MWSLETTKQPTCSACSEEARSVELIRRSIGRMRKVLKARKIFKNWLSATAEYVLWRVGLKAMSGLKVVCTSEEALYIEPEFYGRIIRGYYYGSLKSIECKNGLLHLNGLQILPTPLFNGYYWDIGCAKFVRFEGEARSPIIDVFIEQVYGHIDPRGRVIVDVGAFVGDSAIYFALRGAEKVIAIEPQPRAYKEMLENIELNNVRDRVVPVNAGLASRPGFVVVEDTNTDASQRPSRKVVKAVTLEQVVRDYNVEPDVLKMDCEGCEFDVIVNDYEHVRLFKELIFEYHEGGRLRLANIMDLLSNDYRCRLIEKRANLGLVHCIRKY